MKDYPCDECGYDGPHHLIASGGDVLMVECGQCAAEFSIPVTDVQLP